jgi:hypothetical protein
MGEHQRGREAMDRLIKQQRDVGVPYDVAVKRARKTAIRHATGKGATKSPDHTTKD